MMCRFLEGENIKPRSTKEAKGLIGKRVKYLLERDIDKSGRGYFFPQEGIICDVLGKNFAIDYPCNFSFVLSDIVEMVLVE